MLQRMNDVPENMIGYRATGQITQDDFTLGVIPVIEKTIEKQGTLNYLLVLDPSVKSNCFTTWWQEALLSLKNLRDWHRVAVVTDSEEIKDFMYLFSLVTPGEFKGFSYDHLYTAIDWVSEKEIHINA